MMDERDSQAWVVLPCPTGQFTLEDLKDGVTQ